MTINVTELSYWKSKIDIGDKSIFIKDRYRWTKLYKKTCRYLFISRIMLVIGSLSMFCGFLLFCGIPGRIDMVVETGISDDWSIMSYILHAIFYILLEVVGYLVFTKSITAEKSFIEEITVLDKER